MSALRIWLGLAGEHRDDALPLWHGVGERTKWGSLLACLILSILVFFTAHWLLDGPTGFAAYLPALCAAGTLLLGSIIAERALVRSERGSQSSNSEE